MSNHGSIRNLEQLQEEDDERTMPRSATTALVGLGGACIVFAALALGGRTNKAAAPKADPLGDLVALRSRAQPSASAASPLASRPPTDLSAREVTFPQILSDDDNTTTALAAVRSGGSAEAAAAPPPPPNRPPPPTDRLPVVPLPAQTLLEATPVVTRPRDALTKAATDAAQIDSPPAAEAPAGHDGGYQLQVSSFRSQSEAQGFADQLRARGHKAYVLEANVQGRGTWYRVRVGPFTTQHAASQYRTAFEEREHVVPFIVVPESGAKGH